MTNVAPSFQQTPAKNWDPLKLHPFFENMIDLKLGSLLNPNYNQFN